MTRKIKVKLKENPYNTYIGDNALDLLVARINSLGTDKVLVIVDINVLKYHSVLIKNLCSQLESKTYLYEIKVSEKLKDFKSVIKLNRFLIDNFFGRNSLIVGIGGGITGDLVGFLASIYMRGIKYTHIPTTLLSMVDSSVGGKTGINFENRKNIIGTFYQPDSVFIDPLFLKSLPKKELICGAGEIFKYSFLADEENYKRIRKQLKLVFDFSETDYFSAIIRCLNIKINIVSKDERETFGLRKILNLGHTFAHGFEAASDYKISHGEAVIAGIFCAMFVSEKVGYLDKTKLNNILSDFYFIRFSNQLLSLDSRTVYNFMLSDKKNSSGKIKLVLIENIGKIIVDAIVPELIIIESIELMKNHVEAKKRFKRGKLSGFEGET